MVAGLAALVRAPGEPRTRELRAFRSTAVAGFIAFGVYTGVKSAYLSTVFATRVEERNFIFVAPLLFAFSTSLKEPSEIYRFPPQWLPSHLLWQNYAKVGLKTVDLSVGGWLPQHRFTTFINIEFA